VDNVNDSKNDNNNANVDANDDANDNYVPNNNDDNEMAKTATKRKPSTQKTGRKMTGLDNNPIDLDSPPPSKKQRSKAPTCFSGNTLRGFTINPYAQRTKNKINLLLHKGRVPPKNVQPQVNLLPGRSMISVLWKTPDKLFLEMQASDQGIKPNSSRFFRYSDTMQLMVSAGIRAVNGYHRGLPQIIQLDVKCTRNPKIKHFNMPTKQKVIFNGKTHIQFNSMYFCQLKVANNCHGLTAQPTNAGIADFDFLGSQSSTEVDCGGGGGGGGGSSGRGKGHRDGGGAPVTSNSESLDSSEDY
jgi:hypothetical protein